jgi:DnaK suppressor protein
MSRLILPEGYKPSKDEEYMNPMQIEYFRQKLENWRLRLLNESEETLQHLKKENWNEPDFNDRASVETEAAIELKTRDRYRKLIDKIEHTIQRINDGNYGYCEETGEEIGIQRLEARPVATLSIDAQMRHENYEKTHMDEDKIGA